MFNALRPIHALLSISLVLAASSTAQASVQKVKFCYQRLYSSVHLSAHPGQVPATIQWILKTDSNFPGELFHELLIEQAGMKKFYFATGHCVGSQQEGRTEYECGVLEKGAGHFVVSFPTKSEAVLKNDGLRICPNGDAPWECSEPLTLPADQDNSEFTLRRVPAEAC